MNKLEAYKRVIKRLINQKLGKEAYNYPPSFRALIDMIKVVNSYYKREKKKLDYINSLKRK